MVRVLEKRLGALPVVAQFGRRLRIAEVVDALCPVRQVAPISHGEVIEALVANRLTAPAPMVRVAGVGPGVGGGRDVRDHDLGAQR